MTLLVGSVFLDHPRSQAWYELQMKYLHRTTTNFVHAVYLNGTNNFYHQSKVLRTDTDPLPTEMYGQNSHIRGLNALIDHFNDNHQYEHLLLLDSDAFPFQPRWQRDLLAAMDGFDVAAVTRYENLDTFAHPSFFFVKRPAAANLKFDTPTMLNMVEHKFRDTAANVERFFPLIRTNKLNHHPVLCGVYWNRFYHHGAGSRNLSFRLFYSYFNENNNVSSLEVSLFEELMANPDKFLDKLSIPMYARKIY